MIKAVIFDLDGVIVSTDNLHYLAWKKMADEEGIYFDETINHRLRGISRKDSLEIILEQAKKSYTEDEKGLLMAKKNSDYQQLLKDLTQKDILPGVMDLLAELKAKDILIAIGSSSKNAKIILKYIGLENEFDAISDGTNISHSKPHPEVFLKAAEMLDLKPTECAVVEDAISGILAAKNAGMLAFATGDALQSPLKDDDFENIRKWLS